MPQSLIEKQLIYAGKKVRLEVHHLEDQETGRRSEREVVVHPGAVVILPILDKENILLIRNRRYVVGQNLIELPAGTIDGKESPMNCAGRELLEETGYLAQRLAPIGNFYSSPGILTEKMYAFAAYDLIEQETALEEGEEIEPLPTSWDDAIEMIRSGEIIDSKTITTLLLFDRFQRQAVK